MKKLFSFVIAFVLAVLCCSCGEAQNKKVNDDDKELTYRRIALVNNCDEYALKYDYIDTYFYENGNVPLIDINEFIVSLYGFIDTERIRYVVNEAENCLTQNGYPVIIPMKCRFIGTATKYTLTILVFFT